MSKTMAWFTQLSQTDIEPNDTLENRGLSNPAIRLFKKLTAVQ